MAKDIGKPADMPPLVLDGVTFHCFEERGWTAPYNVWRSEDRRLVVFSPPGSPKYKASVDGRFLKTKSGTTQLFRFVQSAMAAAVKAAKAKKPE